MTFDFLNHWMLLGLAALAIPPLIHLIHRRRYDVVDWGAMQFLEISHTTRRRLFLDELLLLLCRMTVIAVLVVALASPYGVSPLLDRLGGRENRDVVLVIDGSDSMDYRSGDRSAHEAAVEWANAFVDELTPGDNVAVLQARQQVPAELPPLTSDRQTVKEAIQALPPPRGRCDLPQAVEAAQQILQASRRPRRDIIVFSDNQRFGWADPHSRERWQQLGSRLAGAGAEQPRLWVVNVDPQRPAVVPNWSLAPLRRGRSLAFTEVHFETSIRVQGEPYTPPHALRLQVDGKDVAELPTPAANELHNGQVALAFTHDFQTAGSHRVAVVLEPDPPNLLVKDRLAADNRQELAVMLQKLPVVFMDNAVKQPGKPAGADFLYRALVPRDGRTSLVRPRLVTLTDFEPSVLTRPINDEPDAKPRVLILCNLPELTVEQRQAIKDFLHAGGRVLVTLGGRVKKDHYNSVLREQDGWLPAPLVDLQGDENTPLPGRADLPDPVPHLRPNSFTHPALEFFRQPAAALLARARFPTWWRLARPAANSGTVTLAELTNGDPFLVERPYGKGSVLLCCVPLDGTGGTNLHGDIKEFPLLVHELVYYLAGARTVQYNLVPGRPLQYQPVDDEPLGTATITPPHGPEKVWSVERWPLVYTDTGEPGPYRLRTPGGQTIWYVVQPDRDGDDLTPCSAEEREELGQLLPMTFIEERSEILADAGKERDLWWWFLLGLIVLLCVEVWFTRRLSTPLAA